VTSSPHTGSQVKFKLAIKTKNAHAQNKKTKQIQLKMHMHMIESTFQSGSRISSTFSGS